MLRSVRAAPAVLLAALVAGAGAVAPPALAHPVERERLAAGTDVPRVEREIVAFRTALADAIKAKDVAKLRDLYAVDYQQTHSSGQTDGRDARIVSVLAGDPVVETIVPNEMTVRVYGPEVAIVTGRSSIPGKDAGADVKWTAVYVKLGGAWKLASSQVTRAPGTV